MDLYMILSKLNISFDEMEHPPVYTVEQALQLGRTLDGEECKNLFLRTKKRNYFLAILPARTRADLKSLAATAGVKSLSFASSDELLAILSLTPGSVSPFGIIHDQENQVTILIDRELAGQRLLFHPNVNTKTLSISWTDLIRFFQSMGHSWLLV